MNLSGSRRLIAEDIIRRHLSRMEQVPNFDSVELGLLRYDITCALKKAREDGAKIKRRSKKARR
jgi:hypothetical protein